MVDPSRTSTGCSGDVTDYLGVGVASSGIIVDCSRMETSAGSECGCLDSKGSLRLEEGSR